MAATNNVPVTLDTPIVVKVLFRGQTKKFKLPLKDLGAHVLPDKVRNTTVTRGCHSEAIGSVAWTYDQTYLRTTILT
jgi:hypothetical protein